MQLALITDRDPERRTWRETDIGQTCAKHHRLDFRFGETMLDRGSKPVECIRAQRGPVVLAIECEREVLDIQTHFLEQGSSSAEWPISGCSKHRGKPRAELEGQPGNALPGVIRGAPEVTEPGRTIIET